MLVVRIGRITAFRNRKSQDLLTRGWECKELERKTEEVRWVEYRWDQVVWKRSGKAMISGWPYC